jgi:predicted acyl esterase
MRARALQVCLLLVAACAAEERATFMVPMRDGVELATDVYLPPDAARPLPAILLRTPYGKGSAAGLARTLLPRGYAFVVQDMRGRFDSQGEDSAFRTDGTGALRDGFDAVEWVAAQGWCDGNVGMTGSSAGGVAQYLAAASAPPHLRCGAPSVAAPSLYHFGAYQGGVFRKSLVEDWLERNEFRPENLAQVRAHASYDDHWKPMDMLARAADVKIPMIHRTGWYDCFSGGTIEAYLALQEHGGEDARGHQILIVSTRAHGEAAGGALRFPEESREAPFPHEHAFFEQYLKGEDRGVEKTPRVHYYVMGAVGEDRAPGNLWRSAPVWPPEARRAPFFFHADATLGETPPPGGGSLSYRYDPRDPVRTLGGANLNLPSGPLDQRPVEGRADVLLFTTPPLQSPLEVTGPVRAVLFVSSDCPDTDFTVKLTDVYPDGRSILLCDGIRRARFRESLSRAEFMKPGEVYRVEVDLWSTSIVFNRGHRIRVAVSSSNFPRFSRNPNTGTPNDFESEKTRVAHNTIHLSGEHASHIVLPRPTGK